MLQDSLADNLWSPFKGISATPKSTAGYFLLVNLVFVTIGGTCKLLSRLITSPGVMLLIVWLIYRLAIFICRAMVYPGALKVVSRSMENDFGNDLEGRVLEARLRASGLAESLARVGLRSAPLDAPWYTSCAPTRGPMLW